MVVLLTLNQTKNFVQFVNVYIISTFLSDCKMFFLFSTKKQVAFW